MMPILIIAGLAGVIYILYASQSSGPTPGAPSTPDLAGVGTADENLTPADVPNAYATSDAGAANPVPGDTGDASDSQFNPGNGPVPIVPTDSDTWPAGDAIWDVAQAIARQEGYGVNASNAPTRNNNPGDISDGFSQYGGEQLDSKITHFPDPETGWNWLYNKLKRVHDGQSSVYANNMTWAQFGAKWASDPNWATGVTRTLGVSLSDRVGDYWNA